MIRRPIGRLGRPALIIAAQGEGSPAESVLDQLSALAALKDRGMLTDEEFATQKAAILAQS